MPGDALIERERHCRLSVGIGGWGKGGPSAVAQEPLEGLVFMGTDEDAGVQTESTAVGPGQYGAGLFRFEKSARSGVGLQIGSDGLLHAEDGVLIDGIGGHEAHFAHGSVENAWGGSSNATTRLLDAMHYRGLLHVARREAGIRVYAAREDALLSEGGAPRSVRLDTLTDVIVRKYAPLPAQSLVHLISRLRYAVPQWQPDLKACIQRAKIRLPHARSDGIDWYWPAGENPASSRHAPRDEVRLLAPFDPIVWDRRRFELFWGWAYRFEAYTPLVKRKLGYYALPVLWRDQIIGWANLTTAGENLRSALGFVSGRAPRERVFKRELDAELERIRVFL